MKIFHSIQTYYGLLGVNLCQAFQEVKFDLKKYGIILLMVICFSSSAAYFMFEATSFRQYAECFYAFVTMLTNLFNLIIIILKMPQIFKLINDFERAIQRREFNQPFFE